MTTFDASIRQDYTSIEGLVLDCHHTGLASDGSLWTNRAPAARVIRNGTHTGANNSASLYDNDHFWLTNSLVGCFVWNVTDGSYGTITSNTEHIVVATLSGGTDNDWDTDDVYQITVPRFGNPYQNSATKRPTVAVVGGYKEADFTAANGEHLIIPLDHDFLATDWTIAFDFVRKTATGVDQYILGFPNLDIHRQNAAGNYGYMYNAINQNGVGDMAWGTWITTLDSVTPAGNMYLDGAVSLTGTAAQVVIAAGDPAGYICSDDGVTNYCDIKLRGIQMWRRHFSPLEIDFAFDTVSPAASHSVYSRAVMSIEPWLDETGTSPEVSRLNPVNGVPHRYYKATIPTGTFRRIQIAASVDGLVVPDSMLGGSLFDISCIEYPSAGSPHVFQSSGWSSVFDIQVDTEGHYTFVVYRDGGGAHVLHVDVEEV